MASVTCERCGKNIVATRRYRIDALAQAAGMTTNAVALEVGISGTTLQDARCHGLTRKVADRCATELYLHPWSVWREMADHDLEDTQQECAAPDCTVRFHGHANQRQRYCTPQCRRRTQAARHRDRNREAYRASQRRWKAEHADEVREYNRRYQRRYMAQWRAKKKAERELVA